MSDPSDHDPQMPATQLLDDDTIDALVEGRPVADQHASLAAFACRVRAAGEGPPPPPAPALARLLRQGVPTVDGSRPGAASGAESAGRDPARGRHLIAKAAGIGIAAKIGLGVTAAAATIVGAGAGGLLPDPADSVVRDAIEVMTPFGFGDDSGPGGRRSEDPGPDGTGPGTTGSGPDGFGEDVSSDATGESDGEPGVDGQDIADEAPGAGNRPSDDPGQPPDDPGSGTPGDPTPPVTTSVPPGSPSPPVTTGPPPDVPGRGAPEVPGTVGTSTTLAGSEG